MRDLAGKLFKKKGPLKPSMYNKHQQLLTAKLYHIAAVERAATAVHNTLLLKQQPQYYFYTLHHHCVTGYYKFVQCLQS